jgi:glyoxylase-like metal-dependent hydrolase (beta-lactamase superfamily II)
MKQPNRTSWKVEVLLVGSWRGATSVLLTSGAHRFVVDTGMPHEAHLLVRALEERGLRPEDIEGVINTHFHVDHVLNNSLFPGSLIYAPQESHDWCCALYSDLLDEPNWEKLVLKYYPETFEYERAQTHMEKLRKLALRMWDPKRLGSPGQFRWTENHPLPEGLRGLMTSGHVPGHLSLIVESAEQPTFIAGDALLSREHDEQVLTMIPVNRRRFQLERRQILERGGRILPGHDREFSPARDKGARTERITN